MQAYKGVKPRRTTENYPCAHGVDLPWVEDHVRSGCGTLVIHERSGQGQGISRARSAASTALAAGWRRFGYGNILPTQDFDAPKCGGLQHTGENTAKSGYEFATSPWVFER